MVLLVNACDVSAAQVSLVFANTTPDDILLKEKLDRLASAHPNFKVNLELEDVPFILKSKVFLPGSNVTHLDIYSVALHIV